MASPLKSSWPELVAHGAIQDQDPAPSMDCLGASWLIAG